MNALLRVKNLSVTFSIQKKALHAVRDISFDLFPGESVGLVGESGCGKSAAVQALLRLEPAQNISGQALFDGKDLLTKSPKQLEEIRGREIGMIFQDPMSSLNPTMKIGEQIAEGLIHHKIASKQEAFRRSKELLHLVGIPEPELRFTQYPHSLSGGMRQRILIAIALALAPRILIADEPTTALDPTISAQILELLKSLQVKLQTSLLLITHDLSVVASACDRILVMYAGKIVEQGNVEEVFLHPKHPYTQMLLGTRPRLDLPRSQTLIPIEGVPPHLFAIPRGCPFAARCPYAFDKCRAQEPPLTAQAACWRAE